MSIELRVDCGHHARTASIKLCFVLILFLFGFLPQFRKSLRFWNAAFFDAVHGEREVSAITRFDP